MIVLYTISSTYLLSSTYFESPKKFLYLSVLPLEFLSLNSFKYFLDYPSPNPNYFLFQTSFLSTINDDGLYDNFRMSFIFDIVWLSKKFHYLNFLPLKFHSANSPKKSGKGFIPNLIFINTKWWCFR